MPLAVDASVTTRVDSLHRLIGNTPLLAIDFLYKNEPRVIYAKLCAIADAGNVSIRDVVRTVDYVTVEGLTDYHRLSKLRSSLFGYRLPLATPIAVDGLMRPGAVLEIEAIAQGCRPRIARPSRTRSTVVNPHFNSWYDPSGNTGDDLCAWTPPPFLDGGFGYPYDWSNAAHGCVKTR